MPTLAELAKMFDHALLQPTATDAELEAGVLLARELNIASVCIKPYAVKRAARHNGHLTAVAADEVLGQLGQQLSGGGLIRPVGSIEEANLHAARAARFA